MIMEYREKAKEQDATERMKRMSHLTMPELKAKADALGVEYPMNVTKGNLLRLVRDSINTPDNELMKIGKHRGKEYREVPWEYGRWASAEVKTTANADPELINFAQWWDRKEASKRAGYVKRKVDDTSLMPGTSSEASSWANASVWEDTWSKKATITPDRQLPVTPNTKTMRRTQEAEEEIMDAEPDEETLEQIKLLEIRLAILKSKAKAKGLGQ